MRTTVLQATASAILATVAPSAAALAQPATTRDSAGIQIAENPSRLKAPVVFYGAKSTIGTRPHPGDDPAVTCL